VADGLDWAEWGERYGPFDMESEPDRLFAPGGESWNSFHDRVTGMLERLAGAYEGRTVVAVCHGGVIAASLRVLLGIPRLGGVNRALPTNTGLTEWEWEPGPGRWTLHSFNEADHLLPWVGAAP
jgi:probable phosphoglycerate mutase